MVIWAREEMRRKKKAIKKERGASMDEVGEMLPWLQTGDEEDKKEDGEKEKEKRRKEK